MIAGIRTGEAFLHIHSRRKKMIVLISNPPKCGLFFSNVCAFFQIFVFMLSDQRRRAIGLFRLDRLQDCLPVGVGYSA